MAIDISNSIKERRIRFENLIGGEDVSRLEVEAMPSIPINRPRIPEFWTIQQEYNDLFSSGIITNSKYVRQFETRIEAYLGVRHAICVSSCTTGLMLLERSLCLTGSVIVPSFTFPATVHTLIWNGLRPIFVDCESSTFSVNPAEVEENVDRDTSAILGVYIFGNPPDMERLEKIADRYKLKLIFDAAHGLGAWYKGKPCGGFGQAEVFSLAPTKLLTSGEGGVIATNNDCLAERLRMGRNYGNPGNYDCEFVGLNGRMPELSALLGLKGIDSLEEEIRRREYLVSIYRQELEPVKGITFQQVKKGNRCSYNYFAILVDCDEFGMDNRGLQHVLGERGISSRVYFYPPVHLQKAYRGYYRKYKDRLPVTDFLGRNVLCLPLFNGMEESTVYQICRAIKSIQEQGTKTVLRIPFKQK